MKAVQVEVPEVEYREGNGRWTTPAERVLIGKTYDAGASIRDLMSVSGYGYSTIQRIIVNQNVKLRPRGGVRRTADGGTKRRDAIAAFTEAWKILRPETA